MHSFSTLFALVAVSSLASASHIPIARHILHAPRPRETGLVPDGQACGADVDCQSDNCQLVNSLFTCVPPGSTGDGSTLPDQTAAAAPAAATGLADGQFCGADVDCQSDNCQLVNSLFTCVPPGSQGDGSQLPDNTADTSSASTGAGLDDGQLCGADVDCASDNCQLVNSLFTCVPPGSQGDGSQLPDNTVDTSSASTGAGLADGEFCGADVDCASDNCQLVNSLFTCVPPGSQGDGSQLPRRQTGQLADGEFCGADVDCQSDNCQLVNSLFTCVPPGSLGDGSTLKRQTGQLADGEFCGADVDCQSDNCQLVNSLFTCVPPGSLGDGSTLKRRQLPDGAFCGADVDCFSGSCQLVNGLFTCV